MGLGKTGNKAEVPAVEGYEDIPKKQVEDDFFMGLL